MSSRTVQEQRVAVCGAKATAGSRQRSAFGTRQEVAVADRGAVCDQSRSARGSDRAQLPDRSLATRPLAASRLGLKLRTRGSDVSPARPRPRIFPSCLTPALYTAGLCLPMLPAARRPSSRPRAASLAPLVTAGSPRPAYEPPTSPPWEDTPNGGPAPRGDRCKILTSDAFPDPGRKNVGNTDPSRVRIQIARRPLHSGADRPRSFSTRQTRC
jgi:hypothetical protein